MELIMAAKFSDVYFHNTICFLSQLCLLNRWADCQTLYPLNAKSDRLHRKETQIRTVYHSDTNRNKDRTSVSEKVSQTEAGPESG